MTDINMHRVVAIQPNVNVFDGFTVYSWVGTDHYGHSVSISFFHRHETDTLVYHPTIHGNYTTKETVDEDVTPTL